jgi:two-component system sensor histidine kinase KdpD
LPEDLPLVEVDAVLLERVFANLLENAAKYSDPGSAIEVSAAALDSHVQIKIADRGRGFQAGHEERMFDKFTRGHEESSVAGTGLGLAICRAIIEAHGGVIKARNRAGGGAVLSFTLPLGKPPAMLAEDLNT